MLWFALAVMTGLAVLAVLWPLAFREADARQLPDSEAAFFRAQLAEIERDVERGQLPPGEAAAARAEAGRRLIAAADRGGEAVKPARPAVRRIAAMLTLVAVPVIALGGYAFLGAPNLPDQPLAERRVDANSPEALQAAIAKVEARLATSPNDVRGWEVLAPVYMRIGRFDDAVVAYRQVLRLKGDEPELRADLAEAEVAAAGGIVTGDARAEFDKALAKTPDMPKAKFYLALAAEQDGDAAKALDAYKALVPKAGGRAPWMIGLRARLAALSQPGGQAPPAQPQSDAPQFSAEQREMINGMVAQLASRLADKGGTADEWARLIRAYSVLHESGKAKDALVSARKAYASDATAAANFDALARELGLGS